MAQRKQLSPQKGSLGCERALPRASPKAPDRRRVSDLPYREQEFRNDDAVDRTERSCSSAPGVLSTPTSRWAQLADGLVYVDELDAELAEAIESGRLGLGLVEPDGTGDHLPDALA